MILKPYHQDNSMTLYCGHILNVLRELPAESVQMCVTSPPYWGLRDYGLEAQIWDDPGDCEHEWGDEQPGDPRGGSGPNAKEFYADGGKTTYARQVARGQFCLHCNAWYGSLGLEPDPDLYVQHIVQVFREVNRVLRKDGTLWLNLGDSYNSGTQFNHHSSGLGDANRYAEGKHRGDWQGHRPMVSGLKPKDLIGIPWRVAFALQADGWWLRSDIIWNKPNPMPESVTDRPTKSHEYLFLLSKAGKYFYDADAIREPHAEVSLARAKRNRFGGKYQGTDTAEHGALKKGKGYGPNGDHDTVCSPGGRNKCSVWTVATQPFPQAHFAVFPEALVTPCILAGSRIGDTVLDPFIGAGTTAGVSKKLNRKCIGVDLKGEYLDMGLKRTAQDVFKFQERT